MPYITVDVDIDISTVLETLSDDEWIDILRGADDVYLAKAGLQRIPDPQIDSLTEHLALVRGTHGAKFWASAPSATTDPSVVLGPMIKGEK